MAKVPAQDRLRIVRMVDEEKKKVADVAVLYGCTPANIYAILKSTRPLVATSGNAGGATSDALTVPVVTAAPSPDMQVLETSQSEPDAGEAAARTPAGKDSVRGEVEPRRPTLTPSTPDDVQRADGELSPIAIALASFQLASMVPVAATEEMHPIAGLDDLEQISASGIQGIELKAVLVRGTTHGTGDQPLDTIETSNDVARPRPAAATMAQPAIQPVLDLTTPATSQPTAPASTAQVVSMPTKTEPLPAAKPARGRGEASGGRASGKTASTKTTGYGLVIKGDDGEGEPLPFRSLEDLLQQLKPLVRQAVRTGGGEVTFTVQQVDLSNFEADAA